MGKADPQDTDQKRVFWRSKRWNVKNASFDSDESLPHGRRRSRRHRPRRWRRIRASEQQACAPALSLPCSLCRQETEVAALFLHRKHHALLAALGFPWLGGKSPQPAAVAAQRQFIVSQLLPSLPAGEKALRGVDGAAQLLLQRPLPAYLRTPHGAGATTALCPAVGHLLVPGLAVCAHGNPAWRAAMLDRAAVLARFGGRPGVCFLGLFAGHGGAAAADCACTELPVLLLQQLSRADPAYAMTPEQRRLVRSFRTVFGDDYAALEERFSAAHDQTRPPRRAYEDVHKALAKAFWRMDRLLRLGRNEVSRVRWSGCSAVTCILEGNVKHPHADKSRRGTSDSEGLRHTMPQLVSGVLHIANTGNVQAVLCRNGKGFCLTKEHTTRNVKERRRVLQTGAVISSNEPYGLLEGQVKTTRGLGFHGNPKLKKSIIPAPQTISVPIDDLCQFLILATNGLWEVLDNKEVTALVITLFHKYKKTHSPPRRDSTASLKGPLLSNSDTSTGESESLIHVLFQYHPLSGDRAPATNSTSLSHHEDCEYPVPNPRNVETVPPEMTNHEPGSERDPDKPTGVDDVPTCGKEAPIKNFIEGAAAYVSRELVNAALEAGSRDNITVMVVFLNGSEYQLLT